MGSIRKNEFDHYFVMMMMMMTTRRTYIGNVVSKAIQTADSILVISFVRMKLSQQLLDFDGRAICVLFLCHD